MMATMAASSSSSSSLAMRLPPLQMVPQKMEVDEEAAPPQPVAAPSTAAAAMSAGSPVEVVAASATVAPQDICTNTSCMMANMLKQRIHFEALTWKQQSSCAKVLSKRAEELEGGKDAIGLLFLGAAWLGAPVRGAQDLSMGQIEGGTSQKLVRQSIADTLDTLDLTPACETRHSVTPALEILRELVNGGISARVGSRSMAHNGDMYRIASRLQTGGPPMRGARYLPWEIKLEPGIFGRGGRGRGRTGSVGRGRGRGWSSLGIGRGGAKAKAKLAAKAGVVKKVAKAVAKRAAGPTVPRKPGVARDIRRVAKVAATSSQWYEAEGENQEKDPQEKQSGVPNIVWLEDKGGVWCVKYKDENTRRITNRWFPLKKYRDENYTDAEADGAALKDALAFREELAAKGILEPIFQSSVTGVVWNKKMKTWRARYCLNGQWLEKHIYPADNTPAEMKRSQEECEKQRLEWEKLYGRSKPGPRRAKE